MTINWKIFNITLQGTYENLNAIIRRLKVLNFLGIIFKLEYEFLNDNSCQVYVKAWKPFRKVVWAALIGNQTYEKEEV